METLIPSIAKSPRQTAVGVRPCVSGKFLFVEEQKFSPKGVTYGAFKPDETKNEYHDLDKIDADFEKMAAAGINTVRIPHTMPPRDLLDIAERHGYSLDLVRDIINKVDRNEYKRQQAAPGLKVTTKAFGIGRRFPIAQRFSE